jgi:internalin A
MRTIFGSRKGHYVGRVGIFLVAVALVAGMMGCTVITPVLYELTISSTTGGSVIVPGEGTSDHNKGVTVCLLAEADEGYQFVKWEGAEDTIANIADVTDASTRVTMNDNYSIAAEFEKIPEYVLTISSTPGGSVTTPGEGTRTYNATKMVGLVAEPDVGYGFVNWSGNVTTIADVNAAKTKITMKGHCSIRANFEEEEAVTFADPNLEAAVMAAIDIDERSIYPSDLKGLESLHANQRNISDLTGLEHCSDVIRLYLYDNQIDDISPLANLTNLTWLYLYDNRIDDISPLANLTNLTRLYLYDNRIDDISPLANLTNLTRLELDHNQIDDVSALANLTKLTELYLNSNNINDISALANLTNLTRLELDHNDIDDVSPLANLTRLTRLEFYYNKIDDVSPLANLTRLTQLELDHNNIDDVLALANLTRLTRLELQDNRISDISALANLTRLTRLELQGNGITDISALAYLTRLTWLELQDNEIEDISPLVDNQGLSEGDSVDLRNNPLSSTSIDHYIPDLEKRGVDVDY